MARVPVHLHEGAFGIFGGRCITGVLISKNVFVPEICFQVCRDRLYVFDSGCFSWKLFLNCDTGFASYFERELYFFLTRKTVFSKKTALSCIFLELVLTTWGLICVRFLLYILNHLKNFLWARCNACSARIALCVVNLWNSA